MTDATEIGIGELLRHLSDLFDRDAERVYAGLDLGLAYRARYSPVLRALGEADLTITELRARLRVTQGAISQTVKLMDEEGLLRRVETADNRVRKLALSDKGHVLYSRLVQEWAVHFEVIGRLEDELGLSLRSGLMQAIEALAKESYFSRIERFKKSGTESG